MADGGRQELVEIKLEKGQNIILCQSHFIKTVEDVYETLTSSSPHLKFGIAFNEASGDRLVRSDGNDDKLVNSSISIAERVGCGHVLVILLSDGYPINVLNRLKNVEEITTVYAATANDVSVVVYDDGKDGRCVLGVIDGKRPVGKENGEDKEKRHKLLRDINYKR